MIAVLQRVTHASVSVGGEVTGSCGKGLFVLLGVTGGDSEQDADVLVSKIVNLRIFTDESDKMNLSLTDIGGEMLIVSNFTLAASCKKGKRPDFSEAAPASEAEPLYRYFTEACRGQVRHVGCGVFGAHMEPVLACDGPVTIILDSHILSGKECRDPAQKTI